MGAYSVFQYLPNLQHQQQQPHTIADRTFNWISYMRCNRGALGIIHNNSNLSDSAATYLESFYPFSAAALPLPPATPADI